MLPDVIKTALSSNIKRITNDRTIADVMAQSEIYRNMLCEVNKILCYTSISGDYLYC